MEQGREIGMDAEQKQKLAALCAQQHVGVLTTHGEEWPTAHLQAFGQTDDLDVILIMLADAEKYHNLLKRPQATVVVDIETRLMSQPCKWHARRYRDWPKRSLGTAPNGDELKEHFLTKNPFEEPFFGYDTLPHDAHYAEAYLVCEWLGGYV